MICLEYTLSFFSEIDKYAQESYCAIHNADKSLNVGDITQVSEKDVPDFNTMFGGSPCQDFSVAGKLQGAEWTCEKCKHTYNPLEAHYSKRERCPVCGASDINKTRSSLLVEWLRFLREKKPRFAIYENVKNITEKKFRYVFDLFLKELDEYGYNTYWKVLNAKDYGIPQNRERVYCVIVHKDVDNGLFEFPSPIPLDHKLRDLLDFNVEKKYYLNEDKVKQLASSSKFRKSLHEFTCSGMDSTGVKLRNAGAVFDGYSDVSYALLSRDHKGLTKWQTVGVMEVPKDGI